tara:strand:- start:382 stop:1059 length:678 start_codon:yes stop_codon:yes gene_type:complete
MKNKNFYNNKLTAKRYFNIIKNYKKPFSKIFILRNFGLFIGDKSFFKILKCFELIEQIKNIKGDVVEFGVWNGNNLITMKKIFDYFKIKKNIIGYDSFKGMPTPDKKNYFVGEMDLINYIKRFFRLGSIKIIKDDIMNLEKHYKDFPKLSMIYIDCDLYKTTSKILETLSDKLNKKGLIVFDEANFNMNKGEGKAAREFYRKNKKKFDKIILKKYYQPDLILRKK